MTTVFGGTPILNTAVDAAGSLVPEQFTATAGQTLFTLTKFIYTVGSDSLIVFIDGVKKVLGTHFTETSNATFTLVTPAVGGEVIDVIGFPLSTVNQVAPILSAPLGGTTIANFSLDGTTPDKRVTITDTVPAGWGVGAGRQTVSFDVLSTNFFSLNPNAHTAVVLRCDTAVIASAVRGQGMLFGNATGFAYPSDLNPTPMVETWFNGLVGLSSANNYTWPNTDGARSKGGMLDGVTYRIVVDSTKTNEGQRYIRYRMWSRPIANGPYVPEVDTGDVLDHNTLSDLTKTGLVFGYVFESTLVGWSLDFSNVKVTWGPAESSVPDQTIKLSRYGAELEGDLNFIGNSRKIKVTSNGAVTDWTYVQNKNTNQATSLMAIPNGSATTANFVALNSSTPGVSYRVAYFGMEGTTAVISTTHVGQADPNISFKPGGSTVATVKSTGINVLGGSKDIGQVIGYSAGITNWGGANATTLATTGGPLDIDNFCTVAYIKNFINGYSGMPLIEADAIEISIRPLYCLFSYLIKNLQDKKVI